MASSAEGMPRWQTWTLLVFGGLSALGGITCVLTWLDIAPKDLSVMGHWTWLLAALIFWGLSVGVNAYFIRQTGRMRSELSAIQELARGHRESYEAEKRKNEQLAITNVETQRQLQTCAENRENLEGLLTAERNAVHEKSTSLPILPHVLVHYRHDGSFYELLTFTNDGPMTIQNIAVERFWWEERRGLSIHGFTAPLQAGAVSTEYPLLLETADGHGEL